MTARAQAQAQAQAQAGAGADIHPGHVGKPITPGLYPVQMGGDGPMTPLLLEEQKKGGEATSVTTKEEGKAED